MNRFSKAAWILALGTLLSVALTGCGGGGGGGSSNTPSPSPTPSTVLSGVAAAGAPIVGTVFVKDSLGVE